MQCTDCLIFPEEEFSVSLFLLIACSSFQCRLAELHSMNIPGQMICSSPHTEVSYLGGLGYINDFAHHHTIKSSVVRWVFDILMILISPMV
ncbi:hypothetical protein IHE45_07G116300 [Dioscorea alata]|nr:hypothetical protein IHE45_07G116300 [Dioscorea alata]